MKQLIPVMVFLSMTIFGCTDQENLNSVQKKSEKVKITEKEKNLTDSIDFDIAIPENIRIYTKSAIFLKEPASDLEETAIDDKGIYFESDEQNARKIVFELKDKFKKLGYLIYISESNFGLEPDIVSVIKSTDQFDILRFEETNGINYGLEPKDVIKKLQEWNNLYPFDIIGADFDFVEAVFISVPKNMNSFSEEVYDFCPDIVDQGTGSVEELAKEMKMSKTLYLWWD